MSFKLSPLKAITLRQMAAEPDTLAVRLHRHDLNGPHHCDSDECYCSPIVLTDMQIFSYKSMELQQLLDSFHAVH